MGKRIEVVELFAGVGGFRLGLEGDPNKRKSSKRFKTIWANQWEPDTKIQPAFDCYQKHFGKTDSVNINRDISEVKNEIPEHTLLVGGFPCQDYSVARTKAKGMEGKKGVLWWEIHDIIKARKPEFILLENVDRLIRSPGNQRGRDFGVMLRCLADLDYCVEWRTINAADYGHVQRRRRVFIFATRNEGFCKRSEDGFPETGFFFNRFPAKYSGKEREYDIGAGKYKTLVDVSDKFSGDFYNSGFMRKHTAVTRECVPDYSGKTKTLGSILEKNVDEKYFTDELDKWKYLKGAKKIPRTSKSGNKYFYSEGPIAFPDKLDKPGRTMLTSEGTLNRSSHFILDPEVGRHRILTPVECERMNYFPDNWTDTGMSERKRYFVMGNALVIPLIEEMGKEILSIYDWVE